MIYLNEFITVQPSRLDECARQFTMNLVPAMERHDVRLMGLWQTWRTSELVAFWELDDNASLDKLDAAMRQDKALAHLLKSVWELCIQWKSKILRPTAFCPTLAQVKDRGLKGGVYLLAVIPLVPEKMQEYLELFPQFGLAYEERYGLKTVGYWRGGGGDPYQGDAFTCTQLCAGESWEWWAGFNEQRGKDPEVRAWMKRALNYRTHHGVSYLLPLHLPY
ncbi:MAG: NIPSNAP family protein [Chloroflexi bacterium]|nr:NIPSNAP family protein [Chloroflexota bacterium]